MDTAAFDPLVTAVRVFTTRPKRKSREDLSGEEVRPPLRRRLPREALVFDTETTRDPAQRLLFGVWRLYRDPSDGEAGSTCVEEGLFHPDDLPDWDPRGYKRLVAYAASHEWAAAGGFSRPVTGRELPLWPLSQWLQERFFRYGYQHRDRCDVVGFNLLFDLGRLAAHWGPAQGYYRGGWSLGLWGHYDETGTWRDRKFHPRLLAKAIDPRRTLFGWGDLNPEDRDRKGEDSRLVDLHTLAFALTDRSLTLEAACAAFGDPYQKAAVEYGRISPKLIGYARQDVEHTSILYRRCLAELERHEGVALEPHRLYSPATVGTRYLEAMGLARPMDKFTEIGPEVHGRAMAAFYGGRAEARIVRTPVPVAYVDASSMYPTVNALLGTWPLLNADNLHVEDVSAQVRSLLADPALLERCFDPATWRDHLGVTLVGIENPDGDVLPVRAQYDPGSPDYGIGVNPLRYRGTLWYTLPDVMASVLLGGPQPQVRQAARLKGSGSQPLQPVRLRGGRPIDPQREDPFVAMVEERRRVRQDQTLNREERERLDLFLKITANATAYGILARFDRKERAGPAKVTVHGPDPDPTEAATRNPEDPGPYCFPPVAASITGAARLLLAMLERAVTDAGGTYAFCDTDSMAIVATQDGADIPCRAPDGSGTIRALPAPTVTAILHRFDPLNPYDRTLVPALWKSEHDSLDTPLWCYAISAKRYTLYRTGQHGEPALVRVVDAPEEQTDSEEPPAGEGEDEGLVDWKEHGLGLYLDPTDPEHPRRDDQGRRLWISQAWKWILATRHGEPAEPPPWASTPALTRFTLSGPGTARWFKGYNDGQPRDTQIRPGSFGVIAHPIGLTSTIGGGAQPAAPYESDLQRWPHLEWYDRRTGKPVKVTTLSPHPDPEAFAHALSRGDVRVSTLGDILTTYRHRPEHKSLAPNGAPSDQQTVGLLTRRPIESAPVLTDLIGKEGNRLIERLTGEITQPTDYRTDYGARADRWEQLALPVLRELGPAKVTEATGRGRSAVFEVLAGRSRPAGHRQTPYRDAAVEHAAASLGSSGVRIPRHPWGILYRYLRERGDKLARRCAWCSEPIPPGRRADAIYCSSHCRSAAHAARRVT